MLFMQNNKKHHRPSPDSSEPPPPTAAENSKQVGSTSKTLTSKDSTTSLPNRYSSTSVLPCMQFAIESSFWVLEKLSLPNLYSSTSVLACTKFSIDSSFWVLEKLEKLVSDFVCSRGGESTS
ncbi:hypothetical protein P8452_31620 [Trifolium repens]|nr:hypothetical protein P8452_31620 [Trifolium repens]